jgi:hypothetical protein
MREDPHAALDIVDSEAANVLELGERGQLKRMVEDLIQNKSQVDAQDMLRSVRDHVDKQVSKGGLTSQSFGELINEQLDILMEMPGSKERGTFIEGEISDRNRLAILMIRDHLLNAAATPDKDRYESILPSVPDTLDGQALRRKAGAIFGKAFNAMVAELDGAAALEGLRIGGNFIRGQGPQDMKSRNRHARMALEAGEDLRRLTKFYAELGGMMPEVLIKMIDNDLAEGRADRGIEALKAIVSAGNANQARRIAQSLENSVVAVTALEVTSRLVQGSKQYDKAIADFADERSNDVLSLATDIFDDVENVKFRDVDKYLRSATGERWTTTDRMFRSFKNHFRFSILEHVRKTGKDIDDSMIEQSLITAARRITSESIPLVVQDQGAGGFFSLFGRQRFVVPSEPFGLNTSDNRDEGLKLLQKSIGDLHQKMAFRNTFGFSLPAIQPRPDLMLIEGDQVYIPFLEDNHPIAFLNWDKTKFNAVTVTKGNEPNLFETLVNRVNLTSETRERDPLYHLRWSPEYTSKYLMNISNSWADQVMHAIKDQWWDDTGTDPKLPENRGQFRVFALNKLRQLGYDGISEEESQ